ncbi:MAG: 4,5-dihydroxyphthalate decarboxylase [Betaproteobacteria bacterium RIFCSPLOWO2_12_FULL_63_13]|nr:MAG: 4,5-dihydroxyphthalate decarboxylase [Betaproteobacteria bacterium RIFCSPLOWO2_02_FULL_63_19]OGA50824.1 MAG: 4,5-dihydroxyphthalate decarboxylase [Betaproteobacteria bacterium RIFCSPLOWO2_12_FULL_63_13]
MDKLTLTLAIGNYDHVRDVIDGQVPVQGARLIVLNLPPEEVFFRFTLHREWDVSEMSMGTYVSMRSQEDKSITALPVFVSRVFRHSMIYVSEGSGITKPQQLEGKRVGIPQWTQTAAIYSRGYLSHDAGVPLDSIEWVQGGVNQAGRIEKMKLKLPHGVRYRNVSDRSLTDMLLAGDLDAVLSARPPYAHGQGVRRMFENYEQAEEAYFRKTGIFPIMHVLAVKTELLERYPWLAMNLYKTFDEAKRRSMERLQDITASYAPLPWLRSYSDRMKALFGQDFWPYGLEPNRKTLEAFLLFAFEQGVCHRKVEPEELFPKQVLSTYKV